MPAQRGILCSCGCDKYVSSRRIERRHLNGGGPAFLQAARAVRTAPSTWTVKASNFDNDHPPVPPSSSLPSSPLCSPSIPHISPNLRPPPPPFSTHLHRANDSPGRRVTIEDVEDESEGPAIPTPDFRGRVATHDEDDWWDDFGSSEGDSEEDPDTEDFDPDFNLEDPWPEDDGNNPFQALFEAAVAEARANGCLSDDELRCVEGFNYKVDTCIPGRAFEKLPRAFGSLRDLPSLFRIQSTAARLSGIVPTSYHCCINSCCAYTAHYESLNQCPYCGEARYTPTGKPRKLFRHIPIIPRLQQFFATRQTAELLDYRAQQDHNGSNSTSKIKDFTDGTLYQQKRQEFARVNGKRLAHRHFSDGRDLALGMSLDGFCPFRRRKQTCWPIILLNFNLPPDVRSHLENLIAVGVIPGPRAPKDMDSFLVPAVSELSKLAEGVRTFDIRTKTMFSLHAYLLYAFGDGPAMAKLMLMKGANGLRPCRACMIPGISIPNSRNRIHYVPLVRPSDSFDPLDLPLRTHSQFMAQAVAVVSERHAGRAENLAKESGIKGVPLLSTLSSISFPLSFPLDFMHLMWENVLKTLIMLWTKDFKGLDTNINQPYHIKKTVWEAIGTATYEAGSTIPSAFGCRVPNIATSRGEFTAEAYSVWTLFLGPVLLRRAFEREEYYDHFLQLVRLIMLCLRFEITRREVEEIQRGFADWVETYERLYYQNDVSRLPTCTLNIHGLLHIAYYILACGPVWCYWAFPMERFCGRLLRTMKSRRFPFASLDKRICELAQLEQIKNMYNLREQLDLSRHRMVETNGSRTLGYPDHVMLQHRYLKIPHNTRLRIAHHVAIRYDMNVADALQQVSSEVNAWGKLQRLEGGDMVHAVELVKMGPQSRDMTFVKYSQLVDTNARFPRRPPTWVQCNFYGQVELFVTLSLVIPSSRGRNSIRHLLLGIVRQCRIISSDRIGLLRYETLGAIDVIDVRCIEGLVGRVKDRDGRCWSIVEREGIFRQIRLLDESAQEDEAERALAGT